MTNSILRILQGHPTKGTTKETIGALKHGPGKPHSLWGRYARKTVAAPRGLHLHQVLRGNRPPILGGSWVVISGVISRPNINITHIRGIVTVLITTHEPPRIGSSLNQGPFSGPYYKGAVLYWGPKRGPEFRELPI